MRCIPDRETALYYGDFRYNRNGLGYGEFVMLRSFVPMKTEFL